MKKKIFTLMLVALLAMSFAGCTSKKAATESNNAAKSSTDESNIESGDKTSAKLPNLEVRFGPSGDAFSLNLDNNKTATEIGRYIGQADWNLPIYHFGDSNVMQYYDIPSSYKIDSDSKEVATEKAGELYYSSPNRIILFYQDAKVKGNYTKVGQLKNTNGLNEAVKNNPVVEGWGNKVISISPAK
ncbi:hypothetical protein K2F43_17750 [Clostridium estertheticum]|uniref:cyclophilin-like fold protein n=1 Tax=Clostridium estertheticum TaxID=238834 RepID=UPI001C6E3CFB|nr:cyclophilin-like fold protein [Clostridium estertheticum]MBW9173042.1 hypothetical protein [Clostridium estertheticum]WLC76137.1 hypothetical protein KTC99_04785 [Clostridium estertheticum]